MLNRRDLKDRFSEGRMPCEEDFCGLIDSMVNLIDDGFQKTKEEGLKVSQLKDSGTLMSFYENATEGRPLWQMNIRYNNDDGYATNLHFIAPDSKENANVLTLSSSGKVGVGVCMPKHELDVNGVVACKGRIGWENEKLKVPADGEWHNITEQLTGCEAYEVIAGVGDQDGEGRFALTRAVAMNVFGCKPRIDKTCSYCGGRRSRIDIRWVKGSEKHSFILQLRTHCPYSKNDIFVRYKLTKLWLDNMMEGSLG